jgi:hypothetical protein
MIMRKRDEASLPIQRDRFAKRRRRFNHNALEVTLLR